MKKIFVFLHRALSYLKPYQSDLPTYRQTITSPKNLTEFENAYLPIFRKAEGQVSSHHYIKIDCSICEKPSTAKVSSSVYFANRPSLREGIICTSCGFNARMRLIFDIINANSHGKTQDLYLAEQHTRFAKIVQNKSKSKSVTLSSYIDDSTLKSGDSFKLDGKNFRFEDLTRLSFPDDSFDMAVTCDVLEHVPDYLAALRELKRVVKKGGLVIIQVPIFGGINDHITRAEVLEGNLIHHLPPEIHGDPNNNKGILAFYNFSYKLIDELKGLGYESVATELYHSSIKGYFTDNHPQGDPTPTPENWGVMLPLVIVAKK